MNIVVKKIKDIIVKILKKLWQNLIVLMIFLLILDLIIGGIFFFKYYLLAKEKEPETYIPLRINNALMENFSAKFQERENNFNAAESKEYTDPFQSTPSE